MRQITINTLSREAFADFGTYSDMLHPDGYFLGAAPSKFFRDRVVANYDITSLVAFSVSELDPRALLIERTEHHLNTCEVLMPMDGDVVLHVGPARKEPVFSELQAFLIPQGTLVCLRPGMFHGSPIPASDKRVHVLFALPELMYRKDCYFFPLPDEEKIEMVFKSE